MNAVRSKLQQTVRVASTKLQKRQMGGGGHAPAPEWTGIDKVVRGVFPEDAQLAAAILGGYATIITLAALKPSGKKAEVVPVKAPSSGVTTIPSVDDDSFGDFIENESNLMKWIESAEE